MNRIIVYVEGGNVQGIWADDPKDLKIIIFDVDNLKAKGKSDYQINDKWYKYSKETSQCY